MIKPEQIPPEVVEAAKLAANEYLATGVNHTEEKLFSAAIDLIRADVLEEAAKVALDEYRRSSDGEEIAAAIRALKEKPND